MQTLKSEYVIGLVESFELPDRCVLVMEDGGKSLFDIVTDGPDFSQMEFIKLASQLFSAVAVLHSNCIFHGDIKLENFVVDGDGRVKVIDFGLSEVIKSNGKSRQGCGSTNYKAPEILLRRFHTLKADIWALGITLYAAAMKEFPFEAPSEYGLMKEVLSGPPSVERLRVKYGNQLSDLISRMLQTDPEKRPTIEECLADRCLAANR